MSIRRLLFINKVKEERGYHLGFTPETDLWGQKGTTVRVAIPRDDLLDDLYVKTSLLELGCKFEDVEEFIVNARE